MSKKNSVTCSGCKKPASRLLECPECLECHKELAARGKDYERSFFCTSKCFKASLRAHEQTHVYKQRSYPFSETEATRRMTDAEWDAFIREREKAGGSFSSLAATSEGTTVLEDDLQKLELESKDTEAEDKQLFIGRPTVLADAEEIGGINVSHELNTIISAIQYVTSKLKRALEPFQQGARAGRSNVYHELIKSRCVVGLYSLLRRKRAITDASRALNPSQAAAQASEAARGSLQTFFLRFFATGGGALTASSLNEMAETVMIPSLHIASIVTNVLVNDHRLTRVELASSNEELDAAIARGVTDTLACSIPSAEPAGALTSSCAVSDWVGCEAAAAGAKALRRIARFCMKEIIDFQATKVCLLAALVLEAAQEDPLECVAEWKKEAAHMLDVATGRRKST
eukprot:jgi/Mesvir1/16851/Mv15739-RA.1